MDEAIALLRAQAGEKQKKGLLAESNALFYAAALLQYEQGKRKDEQQ